MSTLTGKDLNLVKPALTDDYKVTIGTDLPANFQKIDDEFTAHLADNMTKVGYFTRDLSISGVQTVNTGFHPDAIICIGCVGGQVGKMSIGIANRENSGQGITDYYNTTPNSYATIGSNVLSISDASGNSTRCKATMLSTGFSLEWEKAGTGATGTLTVFYLAIRHKGVE